MPSPDGPSGCESPRSCLVIPDPSDQFPGENVPDTVLPVSRSASLLRTSQPRDDRLRPRARQRRAARAGRDAWRSLGHDAPSDDARHLFRRCGPIWLTFAAAHLVAAARDRAGGLARARLAARDRDRDDIVWSRSPAVSRPGARRGCGWRGRSTWPWRPGSRRWRPRQLRGLVGVRWCAVGARRVRARDRRRDAIRGWRRIDRVTEAAFPARAARSELAGRLSARRDRERPANGGRAESGLAGLRSEL